MLDTTTYKKTAAFVTITGLFLMPYIVSAADPVWPIDCTTNTKFAEYKCDVCYDGKEVPVDSNNITLNEQTFSWENKLPDSNQNVYKDSQKPVEINTNIGTAPLNWGETGITWWDSVIWKDYGGVNLYSIVSGGKLDIKKIVQDTKIPLTNIKSTTNNFFVLKIPISYNEIKTGSFELGPEKTTNYCVSYAPKITVTSTTSTTTTPSTTPPTKPTVSPVTPAVTTATTTKPTVENTNTITAPDTTAPNDNAIPEKLVEPDPNAVTDTTEIPSYHPAAHNSAGPAPSQKEATKVATGPEENLLIVVALLLSLIFYPQLSRVLNKS